MSCTICSSLICMLFLLAWIDSFARKSALLPCGWSLVGKIMTFRCRLRAWSSSVLRHFFGGQITWRRKIQVMTFFRTSHDRQISIFFCQVPWELHSQIVPLMNQQSSPARNSQAGHCRLRDGGHFLIDQHGLGGVLVFLIRESRK
jgi:hypothetical protein